MALQRQALALMDELRAKGHAPTHALPVADARKQLAQFLVTGVEREPVAAVADKRIPGPAGEIPVRVYTPEGRPPFPALVYFHGGGFVLGDLETHDSVCRALARRAGCLVMAVDYRLAPEHHFPAAPADCTAAVAWLAEHAVEIGADPHRIAVAGDSAGGNLAAVACLAARDRGGANVAFQLLIYPVTDLAGETESLRLFSQGYLQEREDMVWFGRQYICASEDALDPYASPLRAPDLAGLPPALIITAEYDPLRDEGEAYAARLGEAGVPVTLTRYPGMIHGFFSLGRWLDSGQQAIDEAAAALRAAFVT